MAYHSLYELEIKTFEYKGRLFQLDGLDGVVRICHPVDAPNERWRLWFLAYDGEFELSIED